MEQKEECIVISFPSVFERNKLKKRYHTWGPSRVGHGNKQCTYCLVTDLEAQFAIGPYCIKA